MEAQTLDPATLVITDVAPHTLGVAVVRENELGENVSGLFDPLILKQSSIPRTAKKSYSTMNEQQTSVRVQVYQGDAELAKDNEPVGEFTLDGLPPVPAGAPIEVEFSYNLSGELEVVARAPQWGLEKKVMMRPSKRHLSEPDKAKAKKRLEKIWRGPLPDTPTAQPVNTASGEPRWRTSRQYSRVAALLTHAERKLPSLATEQADQVAALIRSMRVALEHDDERAVDRDERALTDLLFDLA
jgi:molecular chaperone DnaK